METREIKQRSAAERARREVERGAMVNPPRTNGQAGVGRDSVPVRESFDELTSRLQRDARQLLEAETALAKRELQLKVEELKQEARKAAIAGGCVAIAAMLAAATAVLVLNLWLAAWASALIVTVVVAIGAGSFASAIRKPDLVPSETIREVRRDVETLKEVS